MKYYILYNPLAGHGNYDEKNSEVSAIYKDVVAPIDVTTIKNYDEFLAELSEEDVIVLCGGDGTINRFVNSVDVDSLKNDILYYPTGTGNDFVRDVTDVDTSKPFSIKRYLTGLPTVEIDGVCHKFINGVGFGIDGYCCEVGDALKAKGEKNINYTAIAIKGLLFKYKPTDAVVTVDGVRYEYKKVWIAPTMNGKYYGGGMMAAPGQDRLKNETSSLVLFHGSGKLKTLAIFPSIFKGQHIKHTKNITVHKGSEITVEFKSPRTVQIDGETMLGVKSYKVTQKN